MTDHILLIEDDEAISELILSNLLSSGYTCDAIADGEQGLSKALSAEYSLVILDLNLPRMDGLDICRQLKAKSPAIPVIMLTARSEELDKILGFEIGADDYVTKPFSIRELMARVRARLKHTKPAAPEASTASLDCLRLLQFKELAVDLERRRVTKRGEEIDVSAREFELIALLASHAGRPFSRQDLLREIWGLSAASYESNVNTLITRLRRKLEDDPASPRYLLTVYGFGYRFVESQEL